MSVLDVGAYEGYFSFQCEARGAARIVAADGPMWNYPGSTALPNFKAVARALNSRVAPLNCDVENLTEAIKREQFDIVLFLDVLYHAPDPIGYLRNVAAASRYVCVLETFLATLDQPGAMMFTYAPGEVNNDTSNWFAPNLKALDIMCRRAGFRMCSLWVCGT